MNCLLACAENKNNWGTWDPYTESSADNMGGENKEDPKNDKNEYIIF